MKLLQNTAFTPTTTCTISFAPEDFEQGGGGFNRFDNEDVTLKEFKFVTWDYGKPNYRVTPLLQVTISNGGSIEINEYLSCGSLDNWAPSADGETLVAQSDKAKEKGSISKTCNAAIFLASLVTAGVPSSKLKSEKISDLNGIKAHVVRVKRPKDNLKREEGARDPMVLTVSKLISVPWDSRDSKLYAKDTLHPSQFGDKELVAVAKQKLTDNGGTLAKEKLSAMMLQAVPADAVTADGKPARPWAVQRVYSNEFLNAQSAWTFDGTNVSLVPF